MPLVQKCSSAIPKLNVEQHHHNTTPTEAGDVLLQVLLLLLAVDAGEVHPVVPAVLLSLVPVGLKFSLNFSVILLSYLP